MDGSNHHWSREGGNMKVFAFDRDGTIEVNQGPVPLKWVKYLAHETEHKVYAIGNQRLKIEADIPGLQELGVYGRKHALRILKDLFPNAQEYIVVDDINLKDMEEEGWTYYPPQKFYRKFKKQF